MRALTAILAICTALWVGAGAAVAEDLVMPYSCSVSAGTVSLKPSAPIRYAVQGPVDDKPHADCKLDSTGNTVCTTLMVHRFSIACDGGSVPWAGVVEAARGLGLELPGRLPHGYAPIAVLQARLVLPALARFSPHEDAVASEALRPEAVAYRSDDPADQPAAGAWSTVVKAEMRPDVPGNALRVSGIIGILLAAFLMLGLFSARQPSFHLAAGPFSTLRLRASSFLQSLSAAVASLLHGPVPAGMAAHETALLNALSIANARLAEAELAVASLPRVFSLRDVLEGELGGVRARLSDISKSAGARPHQKSAVMIRAVMRDLDRIARIAQGAFKDANTDLPPEATQQAEVMPQCVQDAYRILGLNGEASPNTAKKLVDALRMTWHPDFARDEQDRRVREVRMKQINAAWDMIKGQYAEAA